MPTQFPRLCSDASQLGGIDRAVESVAVVAGIVGRNLHTASKHDHSMRVHAQTCNSMSGEIAIQIPGAPVLCNKILYVNEDETLWHFRHEVSHASLLPVWRALPVHPRTAPEAWVIA